MTGEREALVAALAAFPARLAAAAQAAEDRAAEGRAAGGRPLPARGRPLPAGEWGPPEVVRHLIAVETDVHQARLADLATIDDPRWDWTEPGPWPGEPGSSLAALLDRFAALRAATLASVGALDEAGWRRTGTHTRLGRWGVAGLLRNAVDHDEEHRAGLR